MVRAAILQQVLLRWVTSLNDSVDIKASIVAGIPLWVVFAEVLTRTRARLLGYLGTSRLILAVLPLLRQAPAWIWRPPLEAARAAIALGRAPVSEPADATPHAGRLPAVDQAPGSQRVGTFSQSVIDQPAGGVAFGIAPDANLIAVEKYSILLFVIAGGGVGLIQCSLLARLRSIRTISSAMASAVFQPNRQARCAARKAFSRTRTAPAA